MHDNGWHLELRGGCPGTSASSGAINLFVLFGLASVSFLTKPNQRIKMRQAIGLIKTNAPNVS